VHIILFDNTKISNEKINVEWVKNIFKNRNGNMVEFMYQYERILHEIEVNEGMLRGKDYYKNFEIKSKLLLLYYVLIYNSDMHEIGQVEHVFRKDDFKLSLNNFRDSDGKRNILL
jgi:hypothetical protein